MYALVFSVHEHKGTTGHTLTDNTLYSMNSIQTYAQKYMDVCYFLVHLLNNT
jgi:hypothetical protein